MLQQRIFTTTLLLTTLGLTPPVLAQARLDRPFFFQEGQRQLDQEIQKLQQQQQQQEQQQQQLEVPSQLLTVNDGTLQWQKYLFRDGGFSVWMPAATQSQESDVLDTSVGKLSFEVFATQPQSYRFVAAYSNPITLTPNQSPDNFLDAVRDGIVAKKGFKLIAEQPVSFEQYPGKELTMQDGDETITMRIYWIDRRVYVLAADQKSARGVSQDVVNFFNSFRLLQ
jgi:hypothetical protein